MTVDSFPRQPGAGLDMIVDGNDPDDKFRIWIAGEAHPRVVIDASGDILTGSGASAPTTSGSGSYQPLDSDLTAIAAAANQAFGLALLTKANAAAARTALELGSAALAATGAFDAAGAAAAVAAGLGTIASRAAPTGTVVGTTDAQELTNKTLTSPTVTTPTGIAKGDVGLGNVDNTSNATERAATATLTNKRLTKRSSTTAGPGATPTVDTDSFDFLAFTALATAITSMTTNLSGTPTRGQTLWLAFTDDGTARAITWGASFEASTVALPTTTVVSTRLDVGFIWNTVTSKWRVVAVA